MGWLTTTRPTDPATRLTALALLVLTVAAWAVLLAPTAAMPGADAGMPMAGSPTPDLLGAAAFVGAWTVMMTAMMLPSAAPMILLYRATTVGSPARRSVAVGVFAGTYLVVWAAFGLAVYLVQQSVAGLVAGSPDLAGGESVAIAAVLAAAGLYQFTPLKSVCLRKCRSPLSFLFERWRGGLGGAVRLGARHGLYCLGCCVGLMVVLVVAGAMGLAWVALIALVVFAEKLLPRGRWTSSAVGVGLLALAVGVLMLGAP